MGFRFRKSIKVVPGVRLNVSKSGVSTSIGGKGATVNIGKRGTRTTVGIPGSGISYSKLHSGKAGGGSKGAVGGEESGSSQQTGGCCLLVILAAIFSAIVVSCSGSHDAGTSVAPTEMASDGGTIDDSSAEIEDDASGAAGQFSQGETVYVSASSLRMRDAPSATGSVLGSLKQGQDVIVKKRSGDWVQVAQGATLAWIAAKHVSATAPAMSNGLLSSPHSSSGTHRSSHKASTRSNSSFYGGSCPCNGGHVCIGPRGGRYCITSGGHKRYGV